MKAAIYARVSTLEKTPGMTQRYAHHSAESLRSSVEVLDKLEFSTNLAQI